jgi:hypothetical protein
MQVADTHTDSDFELDYIITVMIDRFAMNLP